MSQVTAVPHLELCEGRENQLHEVVCWFQMCHPQHAHLFLILQRNLTRKVRRTNHGHVYSNRGKLAVEKNKAWRAGKAPHIRRDQEDKSLLVLGQQRIRVLFYFPVGP